MDGGRLIESAAVHSGSVFERFARSYALRDDL
jgi:hypothetical protein